jgi:hypothetical protein
MCTDDFLEAVQAHPETYDAHGLSLDPKLTLTISPGKTPI